MRFILIPFILWIYMSINNWFNWLFRLNLFWIGTFQKCMIIDISNLYLIFSFHLNFLCKHLYLSLPICFFLFIHFLICFFPKFFAFIQTNLCTFRFCIKQECLCKHLKYIPLFIWSICLIFIKFRLSQIKDTYRFCWSTHT